MQVEELKPLIGRRLGEMRELLLGQLHGALPPQEIDPEDVRQVLMIAEKEGLDPAKLYEEATKDRPERGESAPEFEAVSPA